MVGHGVGGEAGLSSLLSPPVEPVQYVSQVSVLLSLVRQVAQAGKPSSLQFLQRAEASLFAVLAPPRIHLRVKEYVRMFPS